MWPAAYAQAQNVYPMVAGLEERSGALCGGAPASETADPPPAPDPPQAGTAAAGDKWHFSVEPYIWFAGVHGTVGGLGRSVGVHASFVDLMSHFRFGLQAAVEARRKRLVLPLDMIWIRLGDDRAVPFPNLQATTAKLTASEFLLTPKIGVRLLDGERFRLDGLTGFRYWHFGQRLAFTPSALGLNFSRSQDWADPLVGVRMQGELSPKVMVTASSDFGGWGVGSQLDYQVVGLLGYKINTVWTLQAGYRYLSVDYRSGGFVNQTAMSGAMLGVTINLK
jgi:hypothetical protein